jgi:hypothetical protein
MSKPTRRQRNIVFFVALFVYATLIGLLIRDRYIELANVSNEPVATPRVTTSKKTPVTPPVATKSLPAEVLLDVPFTVQAPFANWDALHQETCEEASLMMVRYFRQEKSFGSLQSIDDELKSLVAWETGRGYEYDVTLKELSRIARDYYSMTSGRVIADPTVEDIKKELAEGRPVILPAAGRLLDNPNFTAGGPPYHMLVIRGYDANGFITNDPGTRRGEKFRYTFENVIDAMHDWTGNKATITSGAKAVLVFD